MYVPCIYGQHFQLSMDQSGKIANPARGHLNKENIIFSLSPFAPDNLVSRNRFGLSASGVTQLGVAVKADTGRDEANPAGTRLHKDEEGS